MSGRLQDKIVDMLRHARECKANVDVMSDVINKVEGLVERFDRRVETARKLIKELENYVDNHKELLGWYDEVVRSYRVIARRLVSVMKIVRSLSISIGNGNLVDGLREVFERNDIEVLRLVDSKEYRELLRLINCAFGRRDEKYHSGVLYDGSLFEKIEMMVRDAEREGDKVEDRAVEFGCAVGDREE